MTALEDVGDGELHRLGGRDHVLALAGRGRGSQCLPGPRTQRDDTMIGTIYG